MEIKMFILFILGFIYVKFIQIKLFLLSELFFVFFHVKLSRKSFFFKKKLFSFSTWNTLRSWFSTRGARPTGGTPGGKDLNLMT